MVCLVLDNYPECVVTLTIAAAKAIHESNGDPIPDGTDTHSPALRYLTALSVSALMRVHCNLHD